MYDKIVIKRQTASLTVYGRVMTFMKWNSLMIFITAALFVWILLLSAPSEARMKEPGTVPDSLHETSPHTPSVSVYYLQELVKEGIMTQEEANRTQQYMVFRYERRQKDLKSVEGMSRVERMNYMKERRGERGNPLKEYADYCGLTYERAQTLMNAMHDSQKGTEYYDMTREHA